MRAPICPEPRHFGNHEVNNFPHNLLPHEPDYTLVTLTAPGKPDCHYKLTAEQLRLLTELEGKGLLCSGFATTTHDMTCFQSL